MALTVKTDYVTRGRKDVDPHGQLRAVQGRMRQRLRLNNNDTKDEDHNTIIIIKLVLHNSSSLKGAIGAEVYSMRITCKVVTRSRAGNFLAAEFSAY